MLNASINYLARDPLYDREKPYTVELRYEDELDHPSSNYIFQLEPVQIQPLSEDQDWDLETHGFTHIRRAISLDKEQALSNLDAVQDAFTRELTLVLAKQFPQYSRFEVIDMVLMFPPVRRRDERFPSDQYVVITHQQPAALVHADYSVQGAISQMDYSFPGQEDYYKDREYDMLNVWRPLVGPNDDWPLTVCDYTSIDPELDIVTADVLQVNRVNENQLLHANPRHRWYYIAAQQPEDLLVFRNTDSTGKRPVAFHTGFYNEHSKSPPRQSCEVRFVAFRA